MLSEAVNLIRPVENILLVSHVSPDADAIGSMFGLAQALRKIGKKTVCLNDDALPYELAFLPGSEQLVSEIPTQFEAELIIGLDSSDAGRLGKAAQPLLDTDIPLLVIDHHATNLNFGTVNYVEPEAASTAEMIPALMDKLEIGIDADIATCLLTGIVTDTLGFSTANVKPPTLSVSARIMEAGADISDITYRVLQAKRFDVIRLWGVGLSNVQLKDGVLWTTISQAERKNLKLDPYLKHELSNFIKQVEGIRVAAVFTELPDGQVKVSLRSKPGHDVSAVALQFNGGGHLQAAGVTLSGPLAEAVPRMLEQLFALSNSAGQ